MTTAPPMLDQVRRLLGTYSIASVRNWLKRCDLPHSANTREELVQRVHGLLLKREITMPGLTAAMIGIEEASSKRTFLCRIPHSAKDLARIDKQLADLKIPLSSERIPAGSAKTTTRLVYAINGQDEFRAKWTELHTRVQAERKTRSWTETKIPKVVVLAVNKSTGLVQLRCDHPEDEHEHQDNGVATDDAYFSYYHEQAENLLGHPLEPIDLRMGLEKVLKATPRVVTTSYAVDESEDGGLTKRTQRQQNKDVRDLAEWDYVMQSETVRTFEESPIRWLNDMSGGHLNREVRSRVYAKEGLIAFDADCYEEEIEYVLSQLV